MNMFIEPIYLTDAELFQDLTADERDALSEQMPHREVDAETVFYSPEKPTEELIFIRKGRVRLFYLSADGKIFTTAILEAGTFFGEMKMLGQSLYGKYAEAATPCTLCVMSRDDVKTLLLGDLRLANRIVEMLGKRLAETERRLVDLALQSVPSRIASLLLLLAAKKNTHGKRDFSLAVLESEISCTHEELAQMAGVQRETVTRTLKKFRTNNLIELGRGKIVLLDDEGLRLITKD